MNRILVCGGRYFADRDFVFDCLDLARRNSEITAIIHGDASGADRLAKAWAIDRGIPHVPFPAQWRRPDGSIDHGAGPRRNAEMIAQGKPDVVLAFPGGRGTADMVERARSAGLPILRVRRP